MADYITVLTTTDSAEHAEELARAGVSAKVAACAQIDGPIKSVYWWEDAIQTDEEWRVLYKLPAGRFAELEQIIKSAHAYTTPEIIAADITHGSSEYLQWISDYS
ncbi:divalent-cation tolerance protein CutA [Kitasatospora kifunensis]|uniref:Periplasmic divalent cation tolerance protein n=1 Tax=Kitasatospora kifunensis TaxID=58351 RepID=A0A7W7VY56_KITKI|nr:divalent-cation tolerance protein CutA [Kitasatospora kifunensis]MBB4926339.1 periplasmic divalent cation tolerance protein [Kitasatospora kifunensis]